MKLLLRGVALVLLAAAMPPFALAQDDAAALSTERDKASYMIGMDVARSIAPAAPDMTIDAFERGLRNAFDDGMPLVTEAEVRPLAEGLMQRIAARSGRAPAGARPPEVDRDKVGYMVGSDVGRSLRPIKDEIDLAVFMRALRTVLGNGKPLLTDEQATAILTAFSQPSGDQQARPPRRDQDGPKAPHPCRHTAVQAFSHAMGLQYIVAARRRPAPEPRDRSASPLPVPCWLTCSTVPLSRAGRESHGRHAG